MAIAEASHLQPSDLDSFVVAPDSAQADVFRELKPLSDLKESMARHSANHLFELDEELRYEVADVLRSAEQDPIVKRFMKEMLCGVEDVYTWTHTQEVAQMTAALGYRLGKRGQELQDLTIAALLHDIGKISEKGTPMRDALDTPEQPDPIQRAILATHSQIGHDRYVEAGGDPESIAAKVILLHHGVKEKDPYPFNDHELYQEKILTQDDLFAIKIVAWVDAAQAMASRKHEPDRPKLNKAEINQLLIAEMPSMSPEIIAKTGRLLGLDKEDAPKIRPEVVGRDRTVRVSKALHVGHIAVEV